MVMLVLSGEEIFGRLVNLALDLAAGALAATSGTVRTAFTGGGGGNSSAGTNDPATRPPGTVEEQEESARSSPTPP